MFVGTSYHSHIKDGLNQAHAPTLFTLVLGISHQIQCFFFAVTNLMLSKISLLFHSCSFHCFVASFTSVQNKQNYQLIHPTPYELGI